MNLMSEQEREAAIRIARAESLLSLHDTLAMRDDCAIVRGYLDLIGDYLPTEFPWARVDEILNRMANRVHQANFQHARGIGVLPKTRPEVRLMRNRLKSAA